MQKNKFIGILTISQSLFFVHTELQLKSFFKILIGVQYEKKTTGRFRGRWFDFYRCRTRSLISWVRPWFQNWVPM